MALGSEQLCINHPSVQAVARCKQCGKAVCSSCVHRGPTGNFCCEECKEKHQAFIKRAQDMDDRPNKGQFVSSMAVKRWLFRLVGVAVLVVIVAVALSYLGVSVPVLSRIGKAVRDLLPF